MSDTVSREEFNAFMLEYLESTRLVIKSLHDFEVGMGLLMKSVNLLSKELGYDMPDLTKEGSHAD